MVKIQKRLIFLCSAVLMLVTAVLLSVTASAAAWDGTVAASFAGGSGTSDDPYQISNGEELAYLAAEVNGGHSFQGEYIALTADIDLGNENWTPIGTYAQPFRGNFSGNVNDGTNKPVCTIYNLKIDSSSSYQGLFGVSTGYIRVVQIKNVQISGNNYVGGICGQNTGDIIASYVENCSISGKTDVGGICGVNYGTIKNCRNYSSALFVNGDSEVGGICGIDYGEITGCVNYSSVTGIDTVGGICGRVKPTPSSTSAATPPTPVISNCANKGVVSLKNDGYYLGGICGFISLGEISNCLNSGEVSAENTDVYDSQNDVYYGASYIGGICGYAEKTSIEYTINVGKISRDTYTDILGNICGDETANSISKCYYGSEINEDMPASSEGISTKELCTVSNLGFDMTIWEDGKLSYDSIDSDGFKTGKYLISGNSGGHPNEILINAFNFGTESEPNWKPANKVANRSELEAIKNNMGKNYVLVNDIDLSDSEWIPIGAYNNNYYGIFDGNGKTITGLFINSPSGEDIGLFGSSSGTIQNLTVKDCTIIGNQYTGAIAGNNYGTIKNCIVFAEIKANNCLGGICGFNDWKINNCIYIGTVSETSYYGPICGYGPTPTNCYYNSDIFSINNLVSGSGLTTLQLTSSDVLESFGFDTEIWEKKANDKDNHIAYYPNIRKNSSPISVNYETKTKFAHHPTANGFNITVLVKFDGMNDYVPSDATNVACAGSYTITDGENVTLTGKMYDNTEIFVPIGTDTHKCIFTFNYDGTNSSFVSDFEDEYGSHDYSTKWSSDKTDHWKECAKCGDKKDKAVHTFDDGVITVPATEDKEGEKTYTCKVCGYERTESIAVLGHTHVVSEDYSNDKTGHWRTCSGCDEKIDFAAHTFGSWKITVPATKTSDGKKVRSCTVCGYTEEETVKYEKTDAEKAAEEIEKALDEFTGTNDTTADDILDWLRSFVDNNITIDISEIRKIPATEDSDGSIAVVIIISDDDGNTVHIEAEIRIPRLPEDEKDIYYPIIASENVTADRISARAGDVVNVKTAFGYDIIVTANGRQIAQITEKGSFVMPSCKVYVTAVRNETFAAMSNAWNHSYVYSYDSDMNRIKISSDSKRGVITIKLGREYAGREFVIYSGRKSTKVKITEGVLDKNGEYTFKADEGKNYTLVIM